MKCPADNETLVMTDRNGVEIDYCPKCRGVWLDRGELDKIIDRAAASPQTAPPQPQYQPPQQASYHGQHHNQHYGPKPHYKKRESFLSELFDF